MTARLFDTPSAETGATFTPLELRRNTPSSYHLVSGDAGRLAAYLATAGYVDLGPRSAHEAYRLRHRQNGGLAIVYHSGTLLCQGQATHVHAVVALLVEEGQR